jgi:regulator of protease activity HflC (stomatin/prohibitin superfamily)
MDALIAVLVVLVVVGLSLLSSSVRILREYERGVVFRLGRLVKSKDPGLVLLIPVVDRMVRVSLRIVTLRIPAQDIITRDNVPVRVTAVAYFRIIDADRAIVEIEDFLAATSQIAQTSLRAVLGKAELDTLLSEREHLNEDLQKVIDQQTEPWGVKVSIVEIKDVEIPENMQRAIARQAEAERERRAKVINAEGEFQASAKLADAADVMARNPATLQLRYLQTLMELGNASKSSVVIPLPIDLLRSALSQHSARGDDDQGDNSIGNRGDSRSPHLPAGATGSTAAGGGEMRSHRPRPARASRPLDPWAVSPGLRGAAARPSRRRARPRG